MTDEIPGADELLSLAAIAKWLDVAPSAVTNWRRRYDGDFPARAGGTEERPLFRKGDIAAFLRRHDRAEVLERALRRNSVSEFEEWLAAVERASGRPGDVSAALRALADLGVRNDAAWHALLAEHALRLEQPSRDALGRTAQQVLQWGQRRSPELRRLRPGSGSAGEVIRRLVPRDARSVVDLAVGEGEMFFAALESAKDARALALDVDPDAVAIVRSRAASSGRDVDAVVADSTSHYFAGRQYDVVLAEPGPARSGHKPERSGQRSPDQRASETMLDPVERVLAPGGVAFLVLDAEWLDHPEFERERRRLLQFDILDGVLLLPGVGDGRRKVLLVLRPDRGGREAVLLVDGRASTADRIAEKYERWVQGGRLLSSHAVERHPAELLAEPVNLVPQRWLRTEAERLGGSKAAAALQEDLAALRASAQALPQPPSARVAARRPEGFVRVRDLIEEKRLVVVPPGPAAAGEGLPVLTLEDLRRPRGSVRIERVGLDRRGAARGSSSLVALPGDVVVIEERRRVGIAVWRGPGPVRLEGRAVVYRAQPALDVLPEYLAMTLRAQLERFSSDSGRSALDLESMRVPLVREPDQAAAVQVYERLAELEVSAERLRDQARSLRRRLRDIGAGGVLGFDDPH